MRARRARLADAAAIHALIAHYAARGILLPRTEKNVREHAALFLVLEEKGNIAGCVSLETYGSDLAEVRSLAVSPEIRGRGLGARLVQFALAEARRRKIARVFAVTHAPDFFVRQGFTTSSRRALPEKIARDCSGCPKANGCRLVAVIATVTPQRVALPILNDIATSSPAT
ncbi:MAG TPA: GNAT family N-acetyltransferase [Candidatus Limnocylindrales bacterium]|nr:GNAT family N-acetyltransferase [Candidatus Limnocylindrales bacterium]